MSTTPLSRRQRRQYAGGFSMIEILVTLTITSIALLGAAGLQMRALRAGQSSQARTQAIMLASDLAERMEANKVAAIAGSYAFTSGGSTTTVTDCATSACTSAQLAAFDLNQWSSQITTLLPQSTSWSVSTAGASGTVIAYAIQIKWNDRRENVNYDSAVTGSGEEMAYTANRTIYSN